MTIRNAKKTWELLKDRHHMGSNRLRHHLVRLQMDISAWPKIRLDLCRFGIGVFASTTIRAGETILELAGPTLSFEAAVAKGDSQCYTMQIGVSDYIDLTAPGCFVNHSCMPNAAVRGLLLVALSDIQQDTEIMFDYSTTMDEDYWTMDCHCGSDCCRHTISDFKYLPASLQRSYIRQLAVAEFIVESARQFRLQALAS
jgi:SET domain-containing protein